MAAKKRKKTGGRVAGTPNKIKSTLAERAAELKINPFEVMLYFASGDWKALGFPSEARDTKVIDGKVIRGTDYITPDIRLAAAKEAAKYLYPQLKAIELSGPDGESLNVNNSETEELVQEFKEALSGFANERSKK